MRQPQLEECEVEGVPVSPLLAEGRGNPYGSVPGLDDEEPADIEELERQVLLQAWGPILALPVRTKRGWIKPTIDNDLGVQIDAFGTVDFQRRVPELDKARYKADRLSERLRDTVMMFEMVSARLPQTKYRVLKYLGRGVIELADIGNEDMLAFARLYLKAKRLQKEITELRKASWKRRQAKLAEVFA